MAGGQIRQITLRIMGDSRSARSEIDWVNRESDKLGKKRVTVDIDANTPAAKLTALRLQLDGFKNMRTNINIDADDKASMLKLAQLEVMMIRLDKMTAKPKISTEGLAKATVLAAQADMGFRSLIGAVDDFGNTAQKTSNRMTSMFESGSGGFGIFGRWTKLFTGKVALFGGLASIGTLHLIADSVAEVLAVALPAAIALTAFGVAGVRSALDIYKHMSNVHTVMNATGGTIAPMTNKFKTLSEAVRPQVYQIFGDVLSVINSRSSTFHDLAVQTGGVLTHLAARMTVAVTSGKGVSEFMKSAAPDLQKLTDSFGNLFGAIGNILHVMPGYAEILLGLGDNFLKLAEWVTKVGEPVIRLGLLIHGFIVWAGLGASAAFFLGKAVIGLADSAIGRAILAFGVFIADLITMTLTEGLATAATFAFGAALDLLMDNPLIWIGAAVGALAGLVFWMSTSKSATEKWGDSLQKTIDNSATVTEGFKNTQSALSLVTGRLNTVTRQQADTQKYMTVTNLHTGMQTKVLTQAYIDNKNAISGLTDQQKRFNSEIQFNQGRLGGLAKAYGGQKNAMALVAAAGITEQEWQDHSAEGWAIITQKINGTILGYKAMGQTGGTLGNDLKVMDLSISTQANAMTKLNQAWDTFIGNVSGNQATFDTMALALKQMDAMGPKAASSLASAQARVASAQAAIARLGQGGASASTLAANQARLNAAQVALTGVQSKATSTAAQLAAAQARVASAQAALTNSQNRGSVSTSAMAAAQARLRAAQANLNTVQKGGKTSLDGLNTSSLKLNQAFTQNITNINSMFDAWRMAGISNGLFTQGVKAAIVPMLKMAEGSKEGTAQLVALAEEAGYNGPSSMKSLVSWLGNTHDALKTVRNVTNQATEQEALLTGAMQNQGRYISDTLLNKLTQAELKYGKVGSAVDAYGTAIARFGVHSIQAKNAEDKMNTSIITTMHNAGAGKDAIAAMIAKLDHIPLKKAITITEQGLGKFTIKDINKDRIAKGIFPVGGLSTGGKIPGFGGGDKFPALLEGGEAVVPKHLTSAVAPFLAANGVPGFSNGVILSGDKGVLSGDSAMKFDSKFTGTFTKAMERAMSAAMKKSMRNSSFGSGAALAKFASTFATGNNHPYVWGGTSPSGWDCSGFTEFIYKHFGYTIPRTSEAQFGWGQRSKDQPGALVFFNSPAGGPPPGHVGISLGNGRMADAAGTGIGTIFGNTGGNMGFRVPSGGFGNSAAGGGAFGGTVRENQLSSLWIAAGGPRNIAHLMAAIAMAESGGRANAHNASGASGLWQILGLPFPGNPFDAFTNARMAVAKWQTQGLGAWETYTEGTYRQFLANGTRSALPGLAVVGEKGPEIVRMRGGEEVFSNHDSVAAFQAFAKGTGSKPPTPKETAKQEAAARLAEGQKLLTLMSGLNLNSSINKDFTKELLAAVNKFFHGEARRNRDRAIIKQTDALENIRDRLKNQNNLINHLYSDKRAIQQNLGSYGALSNLAIGPTAGTGDNVALSGGQGIKLQLNDKLKNMKAFGAALKRLHQMGLKGSLFRQVVDMGPDDGLAYAKELISGGSAFIKSLTREENELTGVEGVIAKGAASVENGRGWKTGKDFYKGLFSEREKLRKLFKELGKELGEEAGRWFGVPKKQRKAKGFAKGGILREPVWGMGLSGQTYTFGEEGDEFFAPMSAPRSGGHVGGGDTYNIYVTGDSDPDGAARQIITKVRDYKRRHGNQSTGIG